MYRIEHFITYRKTALLAGVFALSTISYAQKKNQTDSVPYLNLDQCIAYGLVHQPGILQSEIGISIAEKTNQINLSGWLPQVNLNANFNHYDELPTVFELNPANPTGPDIPVKSGIVNTLTPQVAATETIFSPDLLYAAKSAHLLVEQAKQAADSNKINIIATISASFYTLLNTLEQINVLEEDTARLAKNVRDTYHQYIGGIVDKTDYKEAIITLNNAKAQLRQTQENVRPQYAALKQQMGYVPERNFNVSFDTALMMHEIGYDTNQPLQYEKRIEYQLLETDKNLQEQNVDYYRYKFLPTLSAFYTYNYEYESNSLSTLLSQGYPYSLLGASVSIPIFTGLGRIESVQRAKMQAQIIDLSEINLKSVIYSQYTSALANYKSNLYDLGLQRVNVAMAKDVYSVVSLQYKQGIVPYLNVITAEDNLISSEVSYTNALFQLILSKVQLDKALGNIPAKH